MSMKVFTAGGNGESNHGRLVKLNESEPSPAYIAIDPELHGAAPILITSIQFGQTANVQYLQSLEHYIYVYVFGENMGSVAISGVGFWEFCPGGGLTAFDQVTGYYVKNSISKGKKVTLTIGKTTITGFLDSFQITSSDPSIDMIRFTLNFSVLPLEAGNIGAPADVAPDIDSEDLVGVGPESLMDKIKRVLMSALVSGLTALATGRGVDAALGDAFGVVSTEAVSTARNFVADAALDAGVPAQIVNVAEGAVVNQGVRII
jgi:hypothetical protein